MVEVLADSGAGAKMMELGAQFALLGGWALVFGALRLCLAGRSRQRVMLLVGLIVFALGLTAQSLGRLHLVELNYYPGWWRSPCSHAAGDRRGPEALETFRPDLRGVPRDPLNQAPRCRDPAALKNAQARPHRARAPGRAVAGGWNPGARDKASRRVPSRHSSAPGTDAPPVPKSQTPAVPGPPQGPHPPPAGRQSGKAPGGRHRRVLRIPSSHTGARISDSWEGRRGLPAPPTREILPVDGRPGAPSPPFNDKVGPNRASKQPAFLLSPHLRP